MLYFIKKNIFLSANNSSIVSQIKFDPRFIPVPSGRRD